MLRLTTSITALLAATACATAPETLPFPVTPIAASLETDPMTGMGDRADDPAIWVNAADPAASLILGTNKAEGLHVYGLDGKERQFLDVGQLNNVDLRENLAVASNDETESLSWFWIDPVTSAVSHYGDTPVGKVEPYGVCLGHSDMPTAAVTYKDGTVQIWGFATNRANQPAAGILRTVKLASKLEGCVFDDAEQRLFIGEEAYGIWSLDLADPESTPISVDAIANGNGLVEDTEGLSIWHGDAGSGYLVASAQAADRFVIYDRKPPHAPRGIITIAASEDGAVDAVTHTDGLDVTSTPLPGYPSGLLVVQDDGNPASEQDQNFKLVDWAKVEAALGLK